jgi:hypothetical protein
MLFSTNKTVINLDIELFINNNSPNLIHRMERVDTNSNIPAMRFLDVFFDPALNFKYHVQQIMSKLSRALYILRTVKNLLTPHTLKSLYYTLFLCHLIYAMPIWTVCNLQLQKDLHIKLKMALRTIAGLKYNDLNIMIILSLPLKNLRFYRFLTLLNFLIFSSCNVLCKNSFQRHLILHGLQT